MKGSVKEDHNVAWHSKISVRCIFTEMFLIDKLLESIFHSRYLYFDIKGCRPISVEFKINLKLASLFVSYVFLLLSWEEERREYQRTNFEFTL